MSPVALLLWAVAVAAPASAWAALVARSRRFRGRRLMAGGTALLGAIAFVLVRLAESYLQRWAGLDKNAQTLDAATFVYAFVVVAPIEQGVKVAALAPVARRRHMADSLDGVVFASAAALGFVTAHNAVYLWGRALPSIDLARALLAVPAHLFFAAMWGYALGRGRKRRFAGKRFNAAFLGAMLFNGVYDYLVFARKPMALLATAPILLCIGLFSFLASRELLRPDGAPQTSARKPRRFLKNIAPPSLRSMREALRRTERPVMLTWIGLGALVTTGVMTTTLALSVALGHRLGVDFAAVDRGDASTAGAAPLVLIAAGAMLAFPIAGYLVARASATGSVLEPAVSAALAILGSLVLLGLAAPVAVVFAIAFAPIAFGLACAGAWIGLAR